MDLNYIKELAKVCYGKNVLNITPYNAYHDFADNGQLNFGNRRAFIGKIQAFTQAPESMLPLEFVSLDNKKFAFGSTVGYPLKSNPVQFDDILCKSLIAGNLSAGSSSGGSSLQLLKVGDYYAPLVRETGINKYGFLEFDFNFRNPVAGLSIETGYHTPYNVAGDSVEAPLKYQLFNNGVLIATETNPVNIPVSENLRFRFYVDSQLHALVYDWATRIQFAKMNDSGLQDIYLEITGGESYVSDTQKNWNGLTIAHGKPNTNNDDLSGFYYYQPTVVNSPLSDNIYLGVNNWKVMLLGYVITFTDL